MPEIAILSPASLFCPGLRLLLRNSKPRNLILFVRTDYAGGLSPPRPRRRWR